MFDFLKIEEKDRNKKIVAVLAAMVCFERRNEFVLSSPPGLEESIKEMFGPSVKELAELALFEAKRMLYEADAVGEVYSGTVNLREIDQSEHSTRIILDNGTLAPFTPKELALVQVLRTLNGQSLLEPVEFLH